MYIKNLSEKPVVFTDSQGRKIQIDSEVVTAFNFGEFIAADEDDFDRLTFVDELGDLKHDLGADMSKNYLDIWNACADYDNAHDGSYITDKITEYNFVTEDLLEYIVKENATDLSRLRSFISDTYDDDIYMLDGYGNLKNVDISDFENLIDDIVSDLQYDITVPLYEGGLLMNEIFKDYPDVLSVEQLMEILKISHVLAYRLVKNGEIKARKVGREYKIPKVNVIAYLDMN